MSLTAVSLPAADVSAVQFNAGKKAHCGQTLALFLDNDGSPIEKKRRERVEVWENCAHVWFSKREEVSGERPIEFEVCVCVCVCMYTCLSLPRWNQRLGERGGWAGTWRLVVEKKKGKKMSGLNMLTQCTLPSSRATICMCTPAATPTALRILHLN